MLLSVIVPVYSTAPYLRPCLESILSQTFRDWELILVDDASTDGSEQICDEYAEKDPRIRVIHHEHGGPARARNQGLQQAVGEVIAFVDSDDQLHPEYLATLLHIMTQEQADVVLTRLDTSWYKLFKAPLLKSLGDKSGTVHSYTGREALERMLYQQDIHSAPFKLYRRAVLGQTPFPEQYVAYEDLYAMLDIFAQSQKVCVTDAPLYSYHKRPDGTLCTASVHDGRALDVMSEVRAWVSSYDTSLLPAVRAREVSLAFHLLRLMCRKNSQQNHAQQIDEQQNQRALRSACWQLIRSHRSAALRDPKMRLKNKLALLLSYLMH